MVSGRFVVRALFGALLAGLILAVPGVVYAQGKMKFETFEDTKKEHRWRLKAANGMVVAVASEGYKAKADRDKAIALIKDGADKLTFEVFEDSAKEYRWRLKAGNGEILATAGEGYKNKTDAEKGKDLLKGAKDAEVVEGKQ